MIQTGKNRKKIKYQKLEVVSLKKLFLKEISFKGVGPSTKFSTQKFWHYDSDWKKQGKNKMISNT